MGEARRSVFYFLEFRTVNESAPRTTRLERFYHEYLLDQNATALLRKVSQHYTPGTLERLLDAQARLTRRAAAMALGHLGDFS